MHAAPRFAIRRRPKQIVTPLPGRDAMFAFAIGPSWPRGYTLRGVGVDGRQCGRTLRRVSHEQTLRLTTTTLLVQDPAVLDAMPQLFEETCANNRSTTILIDEFVGRVEALASEPDERG